LLVFFLALSGPGFCSDPEIRLSPELDKLFEEAGVNGTFVLYDVNDNRITLHNQGRAETRFIPASTFKIANSLIGLSTGVVDSVDDILPYGGEPQYLKSWEQDMGLRDAIKISNVPIYQELARRIGVDRMREGLAELNYGNGQTGPVIDIFWLQGPLKISALEQVGFLARLAQGKLPLSAEVQTSVGEILQIEKDDNWVLYAKTGWTTTPSPHIGWWVGWVVKDKNIYSFAINIDMMNRADVKKRTQLGWACLKALGVL
jgi:beta-lactamase class D